MPSLVFLFADLKTRRLAFDQKTGDAAIPLIGRGVGEEKKQACFSRVCDPKLAAGDAELVAIANRACRERKGVGTSSRLSESANDATVSVASFGKKAALLVVTAPAQQNIICDRVLNIHDDRRGRVDGWPALPPPARIEKNFRPGLRMEFLREPQSPSGPGSKISLSRSFAEKSAASSMART